MNLFNAYAKEWDTERRIKRAEIIGREIRTELKQLGRDRKNWTALEYGCGTGLISFNLYNLFKEIIMIDSSSSMIDVLKSKIDAINASHMIPLLMDFVNGHNLDKKVNLIYTSMVLHHVENINDILTQFYNQLKEDGYLIIVDLNQEDGRFHANELGFNGHNGFDHALLKNYLEESGFKDISVHTFYKDAKIINDEPIDYSLFMMIGKK